MVVELKVRLHCKACEKALRKSLCKIKGVRCVEIDSITSKITVLGYVDRKVVVKAVWKTGRSVQVLPSSSHGVDARSPRILPRGFKCVIPKWSF